MPAVAVSGKIAAHLFASTSGTDSDWIVKLIDVYPEKYAADETRQRIYRSGRRASHIAMPVVRPN